MQYFAYTYGFFNNGTLGVDKIDSKQIINAKISYYPIQSLNFFINVKNILNQKQREFFKTDDIGIRVLGGINFEF